MTIQIQLNSVSEIKSFRDRLRIVRVMYPNFKKNKISNLSVEVFLKQIHNRMKAANFSPKIIDGTVIENIEIFPNKFRIHVKSEYFTDANFDVALAREKGTKKHFVAPREKEALRWVDEGTFRFSKGHEVGGIPALLIIARTVDDFEGELQDLFESETQTWMGGILNGSR